MAGQTYRVRIVRAGLEFEAEGDKKFVIEMLRTFESGHESVETPSRKRPTTGRAQVSDHDSQVSSPSKAVSVREFVQTLDLKKHTDITLAFGYYLERYAGLKEFTPADINNCYYEAKMESSNTSQMIIQNIKRGFLMESKGTDKGRKRFTVTNSGEKHIGSISKAAVD